MKLIIAAFLPAVTALFAVAVALSQDIMLIGIPSLLCAVPCTLFWAGYYIGKRGVVLQSPLKVPDMQVVDDAVPDRRGRRPTHPQVSKDFSQ